ncbi:MAG: hypothetical protein QOK15_1763 [Nocardioidaceae bacterium]|nr:hypothetical protein [Nocardioidaceae bacterium]
MSRLALATAGVAVVVSAGAVVVAAGTPAQLVQPVRHPTVLATSSATLVCPGLAAGRSTGGQSVFAVAPASSSGRSARRGGVATVASLSARSGKPSGRLDQRGVSLTSPVTGADPTVVAGDGPIAAGLTAVQWAKPHDQTLAGTAVAACGQPGDDWWFGGVDTAVGATSRLILSNPTPAIAVVDLVVYGPHGQISPVGGRGIALAPDSSQVLDLARFAPGLDALTLNVHASQGRVVAAVRTDLKVGPQPTGTEWIPAGVAPADDILVDAALAGQSQRVAITNPGSREALVQVHVIDSTGQFVPTGLTDLTIPPGAVLVRDLGPVTDADAAAIRLTSTVPVTAATVTAVTRPVDDVAISGSFPALGDPAVVPVIPGTELSLLFASAGRSEATVTINSFDDSGRSLSDEELHAPGSTLTTWRLPRSKAAAYVVVTVTVGEGLHAVASYEGDAGLAALPVVPGTFTVRRPAVFPASTN